MITRVKLFEDAVDAEKITSDAILTVQLKAGEKYEVKDEDKVPLLQVDNDTKKVKVRGNIDKIWEN